MVEELKDASDLQKLIGKNKGEEDPLLVAQRFLNIFRQLHIFDQKRRDEFNSMILALSPEIRGSFGILPGGSILQEYVDELEISKGIARSNGIAPISPSILAQTSDKESPLAKIKNAQQSSTPAQVNISGDAKLVADASFAQVLSQSVSNALMAANANKTNDFDKLAEAIKENSANVKFAPDEKFATIMARAFPQALQFSDANKKADIKELIAAVKESRKIEFPEGFSFGEGNNSSAPLIANETAFAQSIAMAVAKVINDSKNNSDLSAEIKDLASAVRESRKIEFPEGFSFGSTSAPSSAPLISDEVAFAKTIADAMAKVVNVGTTVATTSPDIRELVSAIKENNASNAEVISQAMISGLSPLVNSLEKNQNKQQSAPANINLTADNNFSEIITKAVAQTFEISEKRHQEQTEKLIAGFRDAICKENNFANQENKSNKNKHNNQAQAATGSEQLERITQDFIKTLQNINDSRKSENREISQAIKDTSKELVRMFAKHTTNKDTPAQPQDKEMISEIITKVAQVQSGIFQEMAKQQTNELSSIISLALKESQQSSINTIVDAVKKLQENRSIFGLSASEIVARDMDKINIDSNIKLDEFPIEDTDKKGLKETIKEKKSSVAKYIKSAFERTPIEEKAPATSSDWGFEDNTTSKIDNTEAEDFVETESEIFAQDNSSETNYVEDENADWEWEYEEDETVNTQGLEGEDWEWEYEETSEFSGEEGEDWEWEYEESESVEAQGLEGEDWEWEYEEDNGEEISNSNDNEINISDVISSDNTSTSDINIVATNNEDNTNITPLPEDENTLLEIENNTIFVDKGEIVIAELRNKQNLADPYLSDNIGV